MKLFSHRTQMRIVKTGLKFANEVLICNTRELNRLPGRQRSIFIFTRCHAGTKRLLY
jgi:hypothetical protein